MTTTRWSLLRAFGRADGQTTTEYLMIAGLITAIAIIVLGVMYATSQGGLQKIANCVLSDNC
jgi:hypothetical protein